MARNHPIFKNITSTGITTLITKSGPVTGVIEKMTISNNSTSNPATVSVQFWDGSSVGYNVCGNVVIPAGTVLVLEDNLRFSSQLYNLRMEVSGTSPVLDVIIH
tara:strand:- start:261 stop:572 length:312 start_codon:yes stop_codon:yes gene_type:complete